MNAIKTYTIANKKKSQVKFGSQPGGKWCFQIGRFTLITKVRGGKTVAQKIGEVLRACFLTNADLTNEARAEIQALLQFRTLADHCPRNADCGYAGMPNRPGYATVEAE
jgi:hypothetical protein